MRVRTALMMCALIAAGTATPARADWILTPFGGLVFGGDLGGDDIDDVDDGDGQRHGVYGVGLGYMGDSALGFEIDVAYTPDFFGDENTLQPENNLVTLMANLVLNAPIGETGRVYLSGGGGLMRSRVDDTNDVFDVDRNDFGVNAGAGIIIPLGERFGLRGDVRYFRNIGDPEPDGEFDLDFGSFDFWRGTAGLSITF